MRLQGQTSQTLSRREWLAGAGSTLFLAGSPGPAGARASGADAAGPAAEGKPYDLLIKGGKVIDPSQDLEGPRDVAIAKGKIARVEADIPSAEACQVVDASGKIVTPGLIDLHTHVFPYVGPYGIEPDPYFVTRGVTTVIDAGTSGAFTFAAFRRYTISKVATRVRALLHVVSIGMVAGNLGELFDLRYCDPKLAAQVAGENRDLIVGFKIRFSEKYTGPNDLEGMKRARAAADEARLPLMIHIGGSYTPLGDLLKLMKKGDVVTHSYNDHPHGLLDHAGKITPEVREARQRGVLFDLGHGAGSFSFDIAEKCLGDGFPPDTISSDLYTANINGPVYDLTTTLSKFLLLGMNLRDIITRCTVNSARTFKFGADIGTLKPGAEADVSVLELREGEFRFTDSVAKSRTGRQKLFPVVTVRGGKLFYPTA
jgi:dihydroorotase